MTFKTDTKSSVEILDPSDAYRITAGNTLTEMTSPVKFINMTARNRGSRQENIGIGTDGKVYYAAAASTTFAEDDADNFTDVKQYWCSYSDLTAFAIQNDGTFVSNNANWAISEKITGFHPLGPVCKTCFVKGESGKIYAVIDYSTITGYIGDQSKNGISIWELSLPAGFSETVVDVAAMHQSYDAQVLFFLTDNGKIYTAHPSSRNADVTQAGFLTGGTIAAPKEQTGYSSTKFKHIYGLSTNGGKSGISAIDEDDNLWFAGQQGNDITGSLHPFALWGAGYKSGFVHMYQTDGAYALKTNGEIWGTIGSKVTGESQWTKIDVGGPLRSLGGLAGNQNSYGIPNLIPKP